MPFSKEDKKKIAAWLKTPPVSALQCTVCKNSLALNPEPLLVPFDAIMIMQGSGMRFILLKCNKCGYSLFFDASVVCAAP